MKHPSTAAAWNISAYRGAISGRVLDAGCGLGDNAIYLAGRGYPVTGFDSSPTAIDQARTRASDAGVEVRFAVADADPAVVGGVRCGPIGPPRRSILRSAHSRTRSGASPRPVAIGRRFAARSGGLTG